VAALPRLKRSTTFGFSLSGMPGPRSSTSSRTRRGSAPRPRRISTGRQQPHLTALSIRLASASAQDDWVAADRRQVLIAGDRDRDRRFRGGPGALRRLPHQRGEIDRLRLLQRAAVGHHGVGQKLVGDLARGRRVAMDFGDLGAQQRDILFLDREIGLGAQAGQRRADLVGGIGEEALHRVEARLEAEHEVIQRLQQLPHLDRGGDLDRPQIGRLPCADQPFELGKRRQRAPHRKISIRAIARPKN
jgi:hypothetical protein